MNELRKIVRAVDHARQAAQGSAASPLFLATVVDVVGSAYRRPTARMLILPDGQHIGSISGGCLERDLCAAAERLTEHGPNLISFDTRSGDTDWTPRYNLGCSGVIYVLVERIEIAKTNRPNQGVPGQAAGPISILRAISDDEAPLVITTVYQVDDPLRSADSPWQVGSRFVGPEEWLAAVNSTTANQEAADGEQFMALTQQVADNGRPVCCEISWPTGSVRMLVEKISKSKPLWVFGAGDDAIPLVRMAQELGWEVTVVDDRASKLTSKRFAGTRMIHAPWDEALQQLRPTSDTAAVLLTHSFDADKMLLPDLLSTEVGYVGVLGPKSRTGKVIKQLHQICKLPTPESLARLRTPVGLDIGASRPAEVAISILGEIIAFDNEREGGGLHQRQAPIHPPVQHVLIECGHGAAIVDDVKKSNQSKTQSATSAEVPR